jgi:gas vesicle protein
MFRFILGLISGAIIGVAAATMSQGRSAADLRTELERIRDDLQRGDFDALGARFEQGLHELQAVFEERLAEFQGAVEEAAEDAREAAADAAEDLDVDELSDEAQDATA